MVCLVVMLRLLYIEKTTVVLGQPTLCYALAWAKVSNCWAFPKLKQHLLKLHFVLMTKWAKHLKDPCVSGSCDLRNIGSMSKMAMHQCVLDTKKRFLTSRTKLILTRATESKGVFLIDSFVFFSIETCSEISRVTDFIVVFC